MTHGSNLSNDGEVTQPGCFENHRKQIMVASNDNVFVQLDAGRGIRLNYIYFNHFINNLIKYLLIVFSQKTSTHKWPIKSSKQKGGIRV